MREGQKLIITKCANGFTVDKYPKTPSANWAATHTPKRYVAGNSTHLGEIVMNLADDLEDDGIPKSTHKLDELIDELSERAYRPEDNGFVDPPKI